MRSLFEPCGSWHVTHAFATGACSQIAGPRFSVWQLVQLSSIVVPTFSSRTFCEPCTLWQDAQVSEPSRTGMCWNRCVLLTTFWWQVAHICCSDAAFSWCAPFGSCTLWHVTQLTLR